MQTEELIALPESQLTKKQTRRLSAVLKADDLGRKRDGRISVEIRYDDECGNGHNSFAITCDTYASNGQDVGGGADHELIGKYFPQLQKYFKWHLCASDGPMHYLANTLYLASAKDCHGLAAGEPSRFEYGVRFNNVPIVHYIAAKFWRFCQERYEPGPHRLTSFSITSIAHSEPNPTKFKPHWTLTGFAEKWHECPFNAEAKAREFCEALNTCETVEFIKTAMEFSEGKPRELDAARRAAIWPDATDEELCADNLKNKLIERLPALMFEFKHDMEELGFTY